MNERIKALKEQAFDTVWDLDKTTIGPSTHFVPEGFEQKFAELIIEECCNRLSEETISHDGYGYNQHELYNRLRKHFGVES
jgi:hypothetical protein